VLKRLLWLLNLGKEWFKEFICFRISEILRFLKDLVNYFL